MAHELSPLATQFWNAIQTPSLPALGPEARADALSPDQAEAAARSFCEANSVSGTPNALLRSAALLWHDALDESHDISQTIKSTDGSFLHGIMHRREPDSSNAKYWFRLVGDHSSFPQLANAVQSLLDSSDSAHELEALSGETWDPFAFVDACSRALRAGPHSEVYQTLQQIQELELQVLVDHLLA